MSKQLLNVGSVGRRRRFVHVWWITEPEPRPRIVRARTSHLSVLRVGPLSIIVGRPVR